jgi:predicted lactoylglutathione lyase
MDTKIFINLPVKDLKKTMEFFGNLGFKFNPVFTDENAACMVISEDIYSMLLTEKFFKNFIPGREICDTSKSTETLVALSIESWAQVDEMIEKGRGSRRLRVQGKAGLWLDVWPRLQGHQRAHPGACLHGHEFDTGGNEKQEVMPQE